MDPERFNCIIYYELIAGTQAEKWTLTQGVIAEMTRKHGPKNANVLEEDDGNTTVH